MGAEMTVEVIERFAQCAYYLGNLLDDVARVYREGMEEEQVKQAEAEHHSLESLYEKGEIDHRTWSALRLGFIQRLNINEPCIEDLSKITKKNLFRWSNVGKKTVNDVKKVMAVYGVKFRGEDCEE